MDWRHRYNEDSEFRRRVDRRIVEQVAVQKARGLAKYGPDFVGDPLQHAFEEAVGLMTYLATQIEVREQEKHG